ncbi:MAG: nickel pincer cofactor biosynthesis protein LarC [Actinobacteria bacterium]|nr:nickel pincer cofactor biosynthesis protein LarC [Actinomycetota bacterium]
MKKSIYIDCRYGISGDMFVSAMVAAFYPESLTIFKNYNSLLNRNFGVSADLKEVTKNGIKGFALDVKEPDIRFKHLKQFEEAISGLEIATDVKDLALEILNNIGEAESRVHGKDFSQLHFHEIGSLDTLLDAVIAAGLVKELKIEYVFSSIVSVGSGEVHTEHGIFSVPAPATVELLKGMPIGGTELKGEVTTPTGASILRALKPQFFLPDGFYLENVGYGFGQKEFQHPNFLRILSGWVDEKEFESLIEVSVNLDDITPQVVATVISELLFKGAIDAWSESIIMKKGRPAFKVCFLCYEKDLEELIELVFKETTTLGVRYHRVLRQKIKRELQKVETSFGEVSIKVSHLKDGIKVSAEYDECVELAKKFGLPTNEIKRRIEHECAEKILKNRDQGLT